MSSQQPPDFPFGPDGIQDLESKSPEIVRFFRRMAQDGSPESAELANYIRQHREMEKEILLALESRLPAGMIMMVLGALADEEFARGINRCLLDPVPHGLIRDFVQSWFARRGVRFDYKIEESGSASEDSPD